METKTVVHRIQLTRTRPNGNPIVEEKDHCILADKVIQLCKLKGCRFGFTNSRVHGDCMLRREPFTARFGNNGTTFEFKLIEKDC